MKLRLRLQNIKSKEKYIKKYRTEKYNDLQISALRELENMRMMKNQLAVQHSKERSEMQENIVTKYICFKS